MEKFTKQAYSVVEKNRDDEQLYLTVYAKGDETKAFYEVDISIKLERFKPLSYINEPYEEEKEEEEDESKSENQEE